MSLSTTLRDTGMPGRSNRGTAIGAALLLGALVLLAFLHVVQGAVESADMRRRAGAVVAAAIGRCEVLRGTASREDCLGRLGRSP